MVTSIERTMCVGCGAAFKVGDSLCIAPPNLIYTKAVSEAAPIPSDEPIRALHHGTCCELWNDGENTRNGHLSMTKEK